MAATTARKVATRPTLGPYMHGLCFQYLRTFTEDLSGRAPILASGRKRGYDVAVTNGWLGSDMDPDKFAEELGAVLGMEGTRLCLVKSITATPQGGYEVRITEGACTAGVTSDVPHCAFTLGVFVGACSAVKGEALIGVETDCSAMNGEECVYLINPL
jgi:hypothetical protein